MYGLFLAAALGQCAGGVCRPPAAGYTVPAPTAVHQDSVYLAPAAYGTPRRRGLVRGAGRALTFPLRVFRGLGCR